MGDPRRRISIPYWSWSGPLQIRFRSLEPDPGKFKYLGSEGAKTTLFNTIALRGMDQTVYVTEGEMDCVTAWMCGLPAVGIPGVENWKKSYWRLFRYRTVVLLADGDEPGEKLGSTLRSDLDDVKIVVMPPKTDVNAFFIANGREELRKYVGAK